MKPKNTLRHFLFAIGAATLATSSASAEVVFDWVEIGNPGNPAKAPGNYATAWTNITASVTNNDGVGAVAYTFRMARNKTTIAEYTEFLNLKAKYIATDGFTYDTYTLDTYRLWNPRMSINSLQSHAGITRSGAGTVGDPFTYTYYITTRTGPVGGPFDYTTTYGAGGNRPVTYVSWFDAARFANWIHNGQGNGDTEDGAYTLNGLFLPAPTTLSVPLPNPGATVRVPSGDEWVKAAYYDPNWGGAGVGGYWLLGNKSNALPLGNNNVGDAGAINCRAGDFAVTPGNNAQDNAVNYLTDVGAYGTGSQSAYGINDMAGLTWDWNSNFGGDTANQPARRQGSWLSPDNNSQLFQPRAGTTDGADQQSTNSARREDPYVGFRLVSPVPVASSPFDTWADTGTLPGTVTFDGDLNGDGVQDGLAFLLGVANPDDDALGLLPTITEDDGDLVMEFDCLATVDRGTSVLNLEYDGDLVAPWSSVPVPGEVGETTDGNVSFVATANGDLIHIVATISSSAADGGGKLFGRLKATE